MGGFTDPENFFLQFRHPVVACLHSQIAARNHDAERIVRCGLNDDFGQIVDTVACFDLGNDGKVARLVAGALSQFFLKELHVFLAADKRIIHSVGVSDDEVEIFKVFGSERRKVKLGLGEVQTLVIFDAEAFFTAGNDSEIGALRNDPRDSALYFAVVDEHRVAGFEVFKDLGDAARDDGAAGIVTRVI